MGFIGLYYINNKFLTWRFQPGEKSGTDRKLSTARNPSLELIPMVPAVRNSRPEQSNEIVSEFSGKDWEQECIRMEKHMHNGTY
jgi:hypothetical protein